MIYKIGTYIEDLKSKITRKEFNNLATKINELIDRENEQVNVKDTCNKLMSVGAVTGDTYCRNPKPCHLHSKKPIEFTKQNMFDSPIIAYDASKTMLNIDVSKLPGKPVKIDPALPKDWGTINLQENNNAIYAKGQENGKKQGRKEMKEKVTKILAKWVHKGEYSLDCLLEDLRNL